MLSLFSSKRITSLSWISFVVIAVIMTIICLQRLYSFNLHQYIILQSEPPTYYQETKITVTTKTDHNNNNQKTNNNHNINQESISNLNQQPIIEQSLRNVEQQEQQQEQKQQFESNNNEQKRTSSTTTTTQSQQSENENTSNSNSNNNQKLNIVLFYADDWTFHTLGAMGNKYVQTPHLDMLVKDGILFTHNCVVTSVCMQSRATLYTGQYSSVHQSYYSWRDVTMYEDGKWNLTLYPLMLHSGQYHTGFFGKYHHLEPPPIPTFTHFYSTAMSHTVNCHGIEKHVTQCNEDDGIQFLKDRPKDQPFFLTLSFFATHAQDGNEIHYQPMERSNDLYVDDIIPIPKTHTQEHWNQLPPFFNDRNVGRARFRGRYDTPENYQHNMKSMYRMATEVDHTCGTIIQLLKDQNVYDNTIIIFTTDNGNFHGEHGLSEKWYAYEESLRVPLIIKDPRMSLSEIGTENHEYTLNIDLAPTILSAAGVNVPDVMQGRDIAEMYLPMKNGNVNNIQQMKESWRKEFLYEFWDNNDDIPNSVALVGQGFKYIYWTDHNYTQYFDLMNDPYEEYDIFTTYDKVRLMQAQQKLDQLRIDVKSGIPQ